MAVATAAVLLAGCTRAVKETVGLGRGAKGVYAEVQPVGLTKDDKPLGVYGRFEMAQPVDDTGQKTPPEFYGLLESEFNKQLAGSGLPDRPGANTLLARVTILHFELAGALGHAFGPFEEVVARVELVDKKSGRVLGKANCIGRSNESVNKGVPKKAEGLAEAVINWIKSRYPTQ
jgi:hypothetical protein